MVANFKQKFKQLYEKIKKIKHFYLYLAVGLSALLIGLYFTSMPKSTSAKQSEIDNNCTEFASSAEYVTYLENKLENVIGALNGVNSVDVAITLQKGFEYVYQMEEEVRTSSNGTSITTTNMVYVDGKPVIIQEIYPVVKGVVVVTDSNKDVAIKLNIIQLIQTMIDIDSSQINVMQ